MPRTERSYQSLSREDLELIADQVPQGKIELIFLYRDVLDSQKSNPSRFWEKQYRKDLKQRRDFKDMPKHKFEWFLDAIDLVARSLAQTPKGELQRTELEEIIEMGGLYDKHYIDKRVFKKYKNPRNWRVEKGYQDQMHSTYIGDGRLQKLVTEHSRFDTGDFRVVLEAMEAAGDIVRGRNMFTIRLSEAR